MQNMLTHISTENSTPLSLHHLNSRQHEAWNDVITAILNCDVKSMRIYLENIPVKFHPDPIL